jgi:hypothetical protein
LLGISLLSAFAVIVLVVYDGAAAWSLVIAVALVMAASWVALPQLVHGQGQPVAPMHPQERRHG